MTAERPRLDTHSRQELAALYGQIREVSPWLPPDSLVLTEPITLEFTPDGIAALTLTVAVNLPAGWHTGPTPDPVDELGADR